MEFGENEKRVELIEEFETKRVCRRRRREGFCFVERVAWRKMKLQ